MSTPDLVSLMATNDLWLDDWTKAGLTWSTLVIWASDHDVDCLLGRWRGQRENHRQRDWQEAKIKEDKKHGHERQLDSESRSMFLLDKRAAVRAKGKCCSLV